MLTILSNHGILSVAEVTPCTYARFLRSTLPRRTRAKHLGEGGPDDEAVSVAEEEVTASGSKLNVFSTLCGDADLTSLSVESDSTA